MEVAKPQIAGAYLRISHDREDERVGVDSQRRDLEKLADQLGWTISSWYVDNDVSASTMSRRRRPEYERMISDAEAGVIDGIMVAKIDRLSRRALEVLRFLEWRRKIGITLADTEGANTESSEGRMVITIKAAVAQAEAERTAERIRKAAETRRLRGRPGTSGRRPFGFEPARYAFYGPGVRTPWIGKPINSGRIGVAIVEEEARLIRDGAKWILSGESLLEVARRFDASGLRPVASFRWTPVSIREMYKRGRLAGRVTHNGRIVGSGEFPAILDDETWLAVCGKLAERAKGQSRAPRAHVLAGLVRCECGGRMQVQHANPRVRANGKRYSERTYFRCSKRDGGCGRVTRDYRLIMTATDEFMAEALSRVPDPSPLAAQTSRTESRIEALEAEIFAARARFTSGSLEAEDFYPLISDLRGEIKRLRKELAATARRVVVLPDALQIWRDDSPENLGRRSELAREFIKGIYVRAIGKGGHHRVDLRDTFEILPA